MALVRLNQVSLAFGDKPVFADVDFAIEPGERVCLIGRNGAGKTTLLRLITGAVQPDAGELWLQPPDQRFARWHRSPARRPDKGGGALH